VKTLEDHMTQRCQATDGGVRSPGQHALIIPPVLPILAVDSLSLDMGVVCLMHPQRPSWLGFAAKLLSFFTLNVLSLVSK
jgi:hypothetical protein